MKSDLEVLIALRELLSERSRWTKRTLARDKESKEVNPADDKACKWCILGGLMKVTGAQGWYEGAFNNDNPNSAQRVRLKALLKAHLPRDIPYTSVREYWVTCFQDRDSTKHSDVLALLDRAIKSQQEAVSAADKE